MIIEKGVDYYAVLGLDKSVSQNEIKKAYRKKAILLHPDRSGNVSDMAQLNNAYEALGTAQAREEYDRLLAHSATTTKTTPSEQQTLARITSTSERFSERFRRRYQLLQEDYRNKPIPTCHAVEYFNAYSSQLYDISENLSDYLKFREKHEPTVDSIDYITKKPLTPELAIEIFIDFLEGDYFGVQIDVLIEYFMYHAKKTNEHHNVLFENIAHIFGTVAGRNKKTVFESLKNITEYIKETSHYSMRYCASLLQNEYFRDLFKWSLVNEGWLLGKNNANKESKNPVEFALQLLDWIPILSGRVTPGIIVNILLQAGTQFQIASTSAGNEIDAMACETMALEMYINAVVLSRRISLDVEHYTYQLCLNRLACFHYKVDRLDKLIPELQERCLHIADVFPFIETPQSNVAFLDKATSLQAAMRRLLHVLIDVIKHNRNCDAGKEIRFDHEFVDVLYASYEACLRQWYQEGNETGVEQEIRTMLMDELLKQKNWTVDQLNQNLQAPWVMIRRDAQGWLQPSRFIAMPQEEKDQAYYSLDAVEINYKSGNITFSMRKLDGNRPESERVISLSDLQELLQKNILGGLLSLDQVDGNMQFHPYNKIRIAPTSIFQTDFMSTMLLTDYFLKLMTVGSEVNGKYPYGMRPIEQMIAHLPSHLKQIIRDFHGAEREGVEESAHRFWIEAEPVTVFAPQENESVQDMRIRQFAIPQIRMVIKKHLLRRGVDGQLVDDESEAEEGWQIYLFNTMPSFEKIKELSKDKPGMVFVKDKREICLIDNPADPEFMMLNENHADDLTRLSNLKKNETGLIDKTEENSLFLYRFVKTITSKLEKPHHFSPEYVFAQEFTDHYDEFSEYLPEFARLRELSRITVFINIMNAEKESNRAVLKQLIAIKNDTPYWQKRYKDIEQSFIEQKTKSSFSEYRKKCSYAVISQFRYNQLGDIARQNQLIDANIDSQIRRAHIQSIEGSRSRIVSQYGQHNWNYNESHIRESAERAKAYAFKKTTQEKQEKIHKQLLDDVYPVLATSYKYPEVSYLVTQFMEGSVDPLAKELIRHDYQKTLNSIAGEFVGASVELIDKAINGDDAALETILNTVSLTEAESNEAKKIINNEKEEVMNLIRSRTKLEKELTALGIGKPEDLSQKDLEGQCLWVPASFNKEAMRLIYGGVHIQPKVIFESGLTPKVTSVINASFDPGTHHAVTRTYLPSLPQANADSSRRSVSFYLRSQQAYNNPQARSSHGASGGSGRGGRSPSRSPSPSREAPQLFENKFPQDKLDRVDIFNVRALQTYTGKLNYVVKKDGRLVVGKNRDTPGGGHIDLANGEPVQAGGEVHLVHGRIRYIDNSSGHYLPHGPRARYAAEKAFREIGFDVEGKYIEKHWVAEPALPRGGKWRPK